MINKKMYTTQFPNKAQPQRKLMKRKVENKIYGCRHWSDVNKLPPHQNKMRHNSKQKGILQKKRVWFIMRFS